MLIRLFEILFPLVFIASLGFWVGKRNRPDLSHANKLNIDVFVPALVFSALANKNVHLPDYSHLALATFILIGASGLAGWIIARIGKIAPQTLMPSIMFNNCGNLGIPLFILTFGSDALAPAVVMFAISNLLHFSFVSWFLGHNIQLKHIWRIPTVFASFAGLAVSLLELHVWSPLMTAIKMLGDISIPLMLFALGVRLTHTGTYAIRLGLFTATIRPIIGMLLAGIIAFFLNLSKHESALLFIFGALPPAVLNYMFAEQYRQEPDKVASMVLLGNLAGLISLPIALALVLS